MGKDELDDYRRKRDLDTSREPAGGSGGNKLKGGYALKRFRDGKAEHDHE